MVKARHKPPSRIRYEQAHPVIAIRVNAELYHKLKELKEIGDKSFADLLKEALGIQKKTVGRAYSRGHERGHAEGLAEKQVISLGNCSRCKKPLRWDLSLKEDIELLTEAINQAHYIHSDCKKNQTPSTHQTSLNNHRH